MKKPEVVDVIDVINTCSKEVKISELDLEKNLIDLGIDSIDFISIIVKLEEMFDFEFPDERLTLFELDSVSKIISVISEVMGE